MKKPGKPNKKLENEELENETDIEDEDFEDEDVILTFEKAVMENSFESKENRF